MAADCTPLAGPTGLSCKSQDPGLGGAVYIGKRGLDPSHRFRRELADTRLGDRAWLPGCHSGRPDLAFCYPLGRGRARVFGDPSLPCGASQRQAPPPHLTDGESTETLTCFHLRCLRSSRDPQSPTTNCSHHVLAMA